MTLSWIPLLLLGRFGPDAHVHQVQHRQEASTRQAAMDARESKKWIGKNVWIYRGVLSAELSDAEGGSSWQIDVDKPIKIIAIRRRPGRTFVQYYGGECDGETSRGFQVENPLEVYFDRPKHGSVGMTTYLSRGESLENKGRPSVNELKRFHLVVADWWHLNLCASRIDPIPKRIRPSFLRAIRRGEVRNGMTKKMALVVWGHPDWGNGTPAQSYASDTWVHDFATGFSETLYFKHGKLAGQSSQMLP